MDSNLGGRGIPRAPSKGSVHCCRQFLGDVDKGLPVLDVDSVRGRLLKEIMHSVNIC